MMKKYVWLMIALFLNSAMAFSQNDVFYNMEFMLGEWYGTGIGPAGEGSSIQGMYNLVMDGMYIQTRNESTFEPTSEKTKGAYHLDKGFISYDHERNKYVYRQFNTEGNVNQFILTSPLSDENELVFETEKMENFERGGKARFTIKKISENEIETIYEVSTPEKEEFVRYGTYHLKRVK